MDAYRDEIFGPVLTVDAGRRRTTRRSSSSTTTRTATARRSSPATAAPPASSSSRSNAGMVGINVPIPVPVAYYSFGGWKDVALRRPAHVRPRGHPVLHARQGRDVALAGPGHLEGRPRLPAHPLGRTMPGLTIVGARLLDARSATPLEGDVLVVGDDGRIRLDRRRPRGHRRRRRRSSTSRARRSSRA